ncbi:MAG: hypothetical protein O7J95_12905, partial [Planctomycetota bacterium]|nr:hypothetical protein [Planctomycetota bacterium]
TGGETYMIRLSGYDGEAGDFVLDLECSGGPPSDRCVDASPIGLGVHTGSTSQRGSDGAASCGASASSPDAWFSYTATQDCLILASTCGVGTGFDSVLSVHSGCPGDPASQITCNDDSCGLQSTVIFSATAGETYRIRVSGFSGSAGDFVLDLSCREVPMGEGADIVVSGVDAVSQVGRLGSTVALSMRSTVCNIGNVPLDWFGAPNPRHPFLVFNVYRLMDDRFEQIGQSWIKHGFAASQGDICGIGCIPSPGGTRLGVGCADIYGVGTNASQGVMSPRSEVNPFDGAYVFSGSHLDRHPGGNHSPIDHRLQVNDVDFDPAQNPDARYIAEIYVLSHDDVDRTNSTGWREFTVTGQPGGTWSFRDSANGTQSGLPVEEWEGATLTVIPEEVDGDGRCYVAAKATDNGDGTWHYEYAVFNLDMNRAVASFSVPLPPAATLSGVGFHAARSHGEGLSNAPWDVTQSTTRITWSTQSFAENPRANAIRWGTLFNFRFDADAEPGETSITLSTFSGPVEEHQATTVGPRREPSPFKRGDSDGDGAVDMTDAIVTLNSLFTGGPTPSCLDAVDSNDSGDIDLSDGVFTLLWLFTGGAAPLDPGPAACGLDPTPESPRLDDCLYDEASCT